MDQTDSAARKARSIQAIFSCFSISPVKSRWSPCRDTATHERGSAIKIPSTDATRASSLGSDSPRRPRRGRRGKGRILPGHDQAWPDRPDPFLRVGNGVTARRLQQIIRIGVLRVPEVVDSSEGFQTLPNKPKAEQLLKEIKEREHGRPIRSFLRERRRLFF